MSNMKFELGATVTATGRIFRRHLDGVKANRKEWYRPDWAQRPITGIYIGVRTYQNGIIEWEEDVGFIFTADEWIKVALIVTDVRQRPIPVLYSEMQPVDSMGEGRG